MEESKNLVQKIGKLIGKLIIKGIKFLISTISSPLLIFIVVVIGGVYIITMDDSAWAETWESTPYVASTYTSQARCSSNGIEVVKEDGSELTAQELWDEMIKNDNTIKNYLDKPEELEKLMNAELITQFPKTGGSNAKLDGIIEFTRYKDSSNGNKLEYKDLDSFNNLYNNKDESILNYFTLEGENAVYVTINTEIEELDTNDSEINISEYTTTLNEDNKQGEGKYKRVVKTFNKQSINYKSMVQKYTMPFDYLWTLLVMSDDKEFVLELADLVYGSQIVISIYDNMTKTVDTYTDKYKKETKTDTYAKVKAQNANNYGVSESFPTERKWILGKDEEHTEIEYPADYSIDDTQYEVNQVITRETDTPTIDITKADVWIVDYNKSYEYQGEVTTQGESNVNEIEDVDFPADPTRTKDSREEESLLENGHALELKEEYKEFLQEKVDKRIEEQRKDAEERLKEILEKQAEEQGTQDENSINDAVEAGMQIIIASIPDIEVIVNVDYVKIDDFVRKIDRVQTSNTSTTNRNYVATTPSTTPKVDKNSDNPNFVKILCSREHKKARYIIMDEIPSWLFEALEDNQKTSNMIDLTKYLFNKVAGRDIYDVGEFDFSVYENSGFSNISTSVAGDILMNYLASWESGAVWSYRNGKTGYSSYISKYITEDKTQYICYKDYENTRNFGYGVCHSADYGATYWHVEEYRANGINIDSGEYNAVGVSKIDVDIVDNVKSMLLEGYQTRIKEMLNNAGILEEISQPQLDSLTCIMYQYGNIGNFVEAYKQYGNTEALRDAAKSRSGKTYFNSNVENNGRSQANWKLFHEGIYTAGTGEVLDSSDYSSGGNGDFLSVAGNVWKTVCTSGRYTIYGGASIPVKGPTIDCSSFASWVIYEYGYTEFAGYQKNTSAFLNTNWNSKYGWEEIPVGASENPASKLQPGDLLVRVGNGTHHITLVVEVTGDGRLLAYDCGNSKANWNGTDGSPVDKTYFLKVNAPGKIIRVKPLN